MPSVDARGAVGVAPTPVWHRVQEGCADSRGEAAQQAEQQEIGELADQFEQHSKNNPPGSAPSQTPDQTQQALDNLGLGRSDQNPPGQNATGPNTTGQDPSGQDASDQNPTPMTRGRQALHDEVQKALDDLAPQPPPPGSPNRVGSSPDAAQKLADAIPHKPILHPH